MWQTQKFEKSFFVVAFSSVVSRAKKKIIMSIAEEERYGGTAMWIFPVSRYDKSLKTWIKQYVSHNLSNFEFKPL